MPHLEMQSSEMKECIDRCIKCYRSCEETVAHCLSRGSEHSEHEHIALLQLCAEVCQTSSKAMLLGSDFHPRVCELCAEICTACAEECESFENDRAMKACAEVCRRCAESCEEMARMGKSSRIGRQTETRPTL